MKTHSFIAVPPVSNGRAGLSISGVLICMEDKTTITLAKPIGDNEDSTFDLDTVGIESAGNFIASFIRRLDKHKVFEKVILDDTEYPIIREVVDPNIEENFVIKSRGGIFVTKQQSVTIETTDGQTVDVPLSELDGFVVDTVRMPKDGQYVKNAAINYIYGAMGLSVDIKWPTGKLIDAIKETRRTKPNPDIGYLIMDSRRVAHTLSLGTRVPSSSVRIPMSLVLEAEKETGVCLYKKR